MSELLDDAAVFAPPEAQAGPVLLGDDTVFAGPELPAGGQPGAPTWFATPDGEELAGQYAIVDAKSLSASHDVNLRAVPEHAAVLAPVSRPRAEHEAQVQSIVREFDPSRIGAAAGVDDGAPVVGPDGLVEAGNSRAVALQRIYQANGQKADDYRQYLREHAASFGITPEAVDAVAKPVLVRVRSTPADRASVGRRAGDFDIGPTLTGAAREIQRAIQRDGGVDIAEVDDISPETIEILQFLAQEPEASEILTKALAGEGADHGETNDAGGPALAGDDLPDQATGGEPEAAPGHSPAGQVDEAAAAAGVTPALEPGWEAFPPETGTLGVPRAEMPQIRQQHRGPLVNFLAARGVTHEADEVPADSLRPTQLEFSPEKAEAAAERDPGDRSVLVSADGRVLDGHHTWLAAVKQGGPIKVIRFSAPMEELLPLALEFPSAETEAS